MLFVHTAFTINMLVGPWGKAVGCGLSSKFYVMFLYYFNLMKYTSLMLLDYLDEGGGDSGILACKNS